MLVLAEIALVIGIRDVEVGLRGLHVQMERTRVAGVRIQPVEKRQAPAVVVNCVEFGRIKKPIGLHAVQ